MSSTIYSICFLSYTTFPSKNLFKHVRCSHLFSRAGKDVSIQVGNTVYYRIGTI